MANILPALHCNGFKVISGMPFAKRARLRPVLTTVLACSVATQLVLQSLVKVQEVCALRKIELF